jgi:hypothetical protein
MEFAKTIFATVEGRKPLIEWKSDDYAVVLDEVVTKQLLLAQFLNRLAQRGYGSIVEWNSVQADHLVERRGDIGLLVPKVGKHATIQQWWQ